MCSCRWAAGWCGLLALIGGAHELIQDRARDARHHQRHYAGLGWTRAIYFLRGLKLRRGVWCIHLRPVRLHLPRIIRVPAPYSNCSIPALDSTTLQQAYSHNRDSAWQSNFTGYNEIALHTCYLNYKSSFRNDFEGLQIGQMTLDSPEEGAVRRRQSKPGKRASSKHHTSTTPTTYYVVNGQCETRGTLHQCDDR